MAAEGLNKVQLIGNLGMDPELKYTQGGQAVMRMRLATTERWSEKGGDKKERTEWHTVIVWGNRGEALNKILAKGRAVYVEGRIQSREWEDKDGGKRTSTEIVATQLLLLGERREQGGEQREARPAQARPAPRRSPGSYDAPHSDGEGAGAPDDFPADDIPF
jgi:single-strand DNA-binding protein